MNEWVNKYMDKDAYADEEIEEQAKRKTHISRKSYGYIAQYVRRYCRSSFYKCRYVSLLRK